MHAECPMRHLRGTIRHLFSLLKLNADFFRTINEKCLGLPSAESTRYTIKRILSCHLQYCGELHKAFVYFHLKIVATRPVGIP